MESYGKPIQGYTLSGQPVVERQKKTNFFNFRFNKIHNS